MPPRFWVPSFSILNAYFLVFLLTEKHLAPPRLGLILFFINSRTCQWIRTSSSCKHLAHDMHSQESDMSCLHMAIKFTNYPLIRVDSWPTLCSTHESQPKQITNNNSKVGFKYYDSNRWTSLEGEIGVMHMAIAHLAACHESIYTIKNNRPPIFLSPKNQLNYSISAIDLPTC